MNFSSTTMDSPTPAEEELITIDNSDNEQEAEINREAEAVKVENEKNNIITYENALKSPKVTSSNERPNINPFKMNTPVLTLRSKPSEWEVFTHIKLNKDVKVFPLKIDFKENVNLNQFYGFTDPPTNRKDAFNNMLNLYNAWRKEYNEINGYNKVEERIVEVININSQPDKKTPDDEEERVTEIPDLNDSNDFPTLYGKSNPPRAAASTSKGLPSRQLIESIDVDDIDYAEPKGDPDDDDFVPAGQQKKKKNKKIVYKKQSGNIFDFPGDATAWQSNAEVAEASGSKRNEPKPKQPEPAVCLEETVACPICNKPFPMSQIENHASDCMFEESVQTRNRMRSPAEIVSKEDAILLSDEESEDRRTSQASNPSTLKPRGHKRLLTQADSTESRSPRKKFRQQILSNQE